MIASAIPSVLTMLLLVTPARAATAQASGADDTTGKLQVQVLAPDGSRVAGVSFEVFAEFRREPHIWDLLSPGIGLPDVQHKQMSWPSRSDAPTEFVDIIPGPSFTIIARDHFKQELGRRSCEGLHADETRLVDVEIVARLALTVRVLDQDEQPVAGATIRASPWLGLEDNVFSLGGPRGRTDDRGEYVVPIPLANDSLELEVSRAGRVDVTHELDTLPPDGEPVVLHVEPMHPLVIRVVDGAERPVPVVAVSVFDDDGAERVAVPLDSQGRNAFFERFETAAWRVEAVPFGERRVRVTPGWGAETTVTSSLEDVTVVLPTHRVLRVIWEPDVAFSVGEVTTLRVLGNDVVSHRVTDDERAYLSADLAVPIGRWTLRLSGLPGKPAREQAIDVRADGSAVVIFRSP